MPEVTDLQINTGVRRELSGRRVDLSKMKVSVAGGVVTLAGELAFVGLTKTQEETSVESKFLASCLPNTRGIKHLNFQFEKKKKNDSGKWEPRGAGAPSGSASAGPVGEGMHCPSCKTVIKFCPCCGEPLMPGVGEAHSRVAVAGRPVLKGLPLRKPEAARPVLKPLPGLKTGESRLKPEGGPPETPTERVPTGPVAPLRPVVPPVESRIKPLPIPAKPSIGTSSAPATSVPATTQSPVTPVKPVVPLKPPLGEVKPETPRKIEPAVPPAPAKPIVPVAKPVPQPAKPVIEPTKPPQLTLSKDDEPTEDFTLSLEPPAKPEPPSDQLSAGHAPPQVTQKPEPDDLATDARKPVDLEPPALPPAKQPDPAIPSTPKPETPEPAKPAATAAPQARGEPLIPLKKPGPVAKPPVMPPLPPDEPTDFDLSLELKPAAKPESKPLPKPEAKGMPSAPAPAGDGGLSLDDSLDDLLPPLKPATPPGVAGAKTAPVKPASASKPPAKADEGALPDLGLDLDAGLLPPLKPATPPKPAVRPADKHVPKVAPEAATGDDDVPLPPMKAKTPAAPGAEPAAGGDDDLESLLPPLKTKSGPATPTAKPGAAGPDVIEIENPFSPLFDDTPLPPQKPAGKPAAPAAAKPGAKPQGGGKDGLDDLSNVDFGLLDLFQLDGKEPAAKGPAAAPKPAAKPAKPAAGAKPATEDPLGLDNIFDLDAPVPDTKPKGPAKKNPDPQGSGDVDFKKFKL